MDQAVLVTFWVAMALLTGATILYVYFFIDKRRIMSWYATFLTGAGFLTLTASILLRWVDKGRFPVQGIFESLSLLAWTLVLIYFIVEHLARVKTLGTLLVPASLVAMAIGQFFFHTQTEVRTIAEGWRVALHVGLIMLSYAGFAINAAASLTYLVQESQIKKHHTNVFFRRLPSLAQTDLIAKRAALWAFPSFTAGILLGTLRAIQYDVAGWWQDPRVMLSGIIWVVFGAYLFVRYRSSLAARTGAWIAMAAFVLVVINAVLARTIPSGFHVFGT